MEEVEVREHERAKPKTVFLASELAELIRDRLAVKGETLEWLADASGVDAGELRRVLRGEYRTISPFLADRITTALNAYHLYLCLTPVEDGRARANRARPSVPAEACARSIEKRLRRDRVSLRELACQSGVSYRTLKAILDCKQPHTTVSVARKIDPALVESV